VALLQQSPQTAEELFANEEISALSAVFFPSAIDLSNLALLFGGTKLSSKIGVLETLGGVGPQLSWINHFGQRLGLSVDDIDGRRGAAH
jgi:hypothetical protein